MTRRIWCRWANMCRRGALMTALGVARLAPGDLDFKPGPGPRTLDLPGFARGRRADLL